MVFRAGQEVTINDNGEGAIRHWLVVGSTARIIRKAYPDHEIYDVVGVHENGSMANQRIRASSLRPAQVFDTNQKASILLDGDYE